MVKTIESSLELQRMIAICSSSSGVCGRKLRLTHYELGKIMASQICDQEKLIGKRVAIIIMMRAGLPFGLGLADDLDADCETEIFFTPIDDFDEWKYDVIIIADAVINTGKTILDFLSKLKNPNIILVSNVMSEKSLENFKDLNVYATRISSNSYKGSKVQVLKNGQGPDTGDRLFTNLFFD